MAGKSKMILLIASVAAIMLAPAPSFGKQERLHNVAPVRDLSDQQDSPWNEDSSTITNDVKWTDKAGQKIKANRASTISKKFGDYWYMTGSASKPELQECQDYTDETAGNIYIYKSKNLGSNSWEKVALITELIGDDGNSKNMDASGCAMDQHPTNEKFYIHCRTIVCVTKSSLPEDFDDAEKHDCSRQLNFPEDPEDPSPRRGGDGGVSFRKDDDLYYVTIRVQDRTEPGGKNGNRKLYIYKLNRKWDQIEEITASRIYDGRESPDIVEHNSKFYLFASENKKWEWSKTHYLRSDSLEGFGLATVKDEVLKMFAENGLSNKNSFASQISFIQNFGTITDPQYMFSGRRHPIEDPCFMAENWGSHIMTPLKFNDAGKPGVYWKKSFNWMSKSSFDWESDNNKLDRFPKDKQYFKPVCDETDDELFCEFNPDPNPKTCRDEYAEKNLKCKETGPSTAAPTILGPPSKAPSTKVPTSAVVCEGLSKNNCSKYDACAYGKKMLTYCLPREEFEHECSNYQWKNQCNNNEFCIYKSGTCVHRCDGLGRTKCNKKTIQYNNEDTKICLVNRVTNLCHKCNPVTCV